MRTLEKFRSAANVDRSFRAITLGPGTVPASLIYGKSARRRRFAQSPNYTVSTKSQHSQRAVIAKGCDLSSVWDRQASSQAIRRRSQRPPNCVAHRASDSRMEPC